MDSLHRQMESCELSTSEESLVEYYERQNAKEEGNYHKERQTELRTGE